MSDLVNRALLGQIEEKGHREADDSLQRLGAAIACTVVVRRQSNSADIVSDRDIEAVGRRVRVSNDGDEVAVVLEELVEPLNGIDGKGSPVQP